MHYVCHHTLEHMHKRYKEDILLLGRARVGDESAYSKLFHVYYDIILHSIMKIIKNHTDAEDLTMITFEKAFSNLDKYVSTFGFGFGTWLSTVGRNTALDFLDRKKTKPSDFVDVFDSTIQMSHSETPEEQYIHKEIGRSLDNAIGKLQNNYQDIIHWRYYEDLAFKEITLKYGVKEEIAKSYMYRARKQLRNSFFT